jgi:hypothetical protein
MTDERDIVSGYPFRRPRSPSPRRGLAEVRWCSWQRRQTGPSDLGAGARAYEIAGAGEPVKRMHGARPSGFTPLVVLDLGDALSLAQLGDQVLIAGALEHETKFLCSVKLLTGSDRRGRRKIAAHQSAATEGRGRDDHRRSDQDHILEDVLALQGGGVVRTGEETRGE